MSAQEQITRLQGLLQRIQVNTAKPRAASAPTFVQPAAAPVAAMPTPVAPAPAMATPEPSPAPVEVDVAFESAPPAAASPQPPEAEPIPLVAAAPPAVAPPVAPPVDDGYMDSEVSEVRFSTGTRDPAPDVTVAAIEAEAEVEAIAAEELSEDDLVEVTEAPEVSAAGSTDVDIDFDDEEEQPPASSKRQVASTMDEALAAAAADEATEHEVPIKTPPPESGPQEAPLPAGMAAPAAPDVDALLGDELDIPTRTASHAMPGPTPEQLGQTIDLEEARGPSLELAEQQAAAARQAHVEELEVPLPGHQASGGFHADLMPPPQALDDLDAHRRRMEEDSLPPPESLAQLPSVQPGAAREVVPAQAAPSAELAPEIVARAVPAGSPEAFTSVREQFRPSSFMELLDASLGLNGG